MIRSKEARQRANQILSVLSINTNPIPLEQIAKYLDFEIIYFDFPEHISAITHIENGKKHIGVNKNHAEVRQRFSIAHEFGHFICGHESYDHDRTKTEGLPKYLDPHNKQELEADEFAAELLMPEFLLKNEKIDSILNVAKKYNVSEQAMCIQLMNLNLLSKK